MSRFDIWPFFQHTSRVFHDAAGRVIKQDSGVWINPLDYLGLEPMVKYVPQLKGAKHPSMDGVYGGFPYYVPIRNLAKYVFANSLARFL